MNSIEVDFENCYGIKKLNQTFDFVNGCAHIIYAPNGAMKSSFARIFNDISNGEQPTDRIFTSRIPKCVIKVNETESINPKSIFVIDRYKENYNSKSATTLLVNQNLRAKYEEVLKTINDKRFELTKKLQEKSGIKKNIIDEITSAFNKTSKEFFECLESIESIINADAANELADIQYTEIFNDKVQTFLNSKDFKTKIKEYIETYDKLISSSTYFKKGIFNHNNAETISKSLSDNGFFNANHSISLNHNDSKKEILNQEELNSEITNEKNKILTDKSLTDKFKAIDDAITKNTELKTFRNFLENNAKIIPQLEHLDELKKKLWISYLKTEKQLFNELLEIYSVGKVEIIKIVEAAKIEQTSWKNVVEIFNNRFVVPYKLIIKNQDDVILKDEVPNVIFEYTDGADKEEIGGNKIVEYLSTGEQRALYLLNIIFEIEARKNGTDITLLIIDDIADSFDYKNKYAIIEYLNDIISSDKFKLIILTHNFDFYRTVLKRLDVNQYTNNLMSAKNETEIKLVNGKSNLDVFTNIKNKFESDKAIFIACIPFVRNLIEYTDGSDHISYKTLTSLLHIKSEKTIDGNILKSTANITTDDVLIIFNEVLKTSKTTSFGSLNIINMILELADNICIETTETVNLPNKIVLSISIRLLAEKYMITKIADNAFSDSITSHQTAKLLKKFKTNFITEVDTIKTLDQVNLMTPENIHLNSFMYEPILDLSDHHLKKLYNSLKSLNETIV